MHGKQVTLEFSEGKPQRLDKYLVSQLEGYSRSQIQRWIKEGRVRVAGHVVTKTGQLLDRNTSLVVDIPPPQPSKLVPEPLPLDVVFENENLMLVNKPAGMVVHPSPGHQAGTLVHAALAHAPGLEGVGGVRRPGVVHRLDKDTSGLILLAKNDATHRFLQNQFRDRQVVKVYQALVDGAPPTSKGRVEVAIARDPAHRKKMAVVPEGRGRTAISEYRSLEKYPKHTLLEVMPVTGRTHQIRIHLAFLGCPVVGDRTYGRPSATIDISRFFLHAIRLSFKLEKGTDPLTFEAPLPAELSLVLQNLRGQQGN